MGYFEERENEAAKKLVKSYKPKDFEEFWDKVLKENAKHELKVTKKLADFPYQNMKVYDVTYTTMDKTIVNAYFFTPTNVTEPLPCVVQYHGGNGKRTLQWEYPAVGMCCLSIDVRGQSGISPDRADYTSDCGYSDAIISGILDKNEYYLKNVYVDAVRAIEVVKTFPEVDSNRIGVVGMSQGGGITLAVSALSKDVKAAVVSAPSYTCIRNRIMDNTGVLGHLRTYMLHHPEHAETVWENVAYFDGLHFAENIKSNVLVLNTLADPICLPEYNYSVYQNLKCNKEIYSAPFAPHIVTPEMHLEKLKYFIKML